MCWFYCSFSTLADSSSSLGFRKSCFIISRKVLGISRVFQTIDLVIAFLSLPYFWQSIQKPSWGIGKKEGLEICWVDISHQFFFVYQIFSKKEKVKKSTFSLFYKENSRNVQPKFAKNRITTENEFCQLWCLLRLCEISFEILLIQFNEEHFFLFL